MERFQGFISAVSLLNELKHLWWDKTLNIKQKFQSIADKIY